jgi:tetratricopeptide (TPR) repeat protein
MDPLHQHLQAAVGYLELGMPLDAHEELERIEPELRTFPEVLALRVVVYQTLGRWELMEVVAKVLCRERSDEPQWPLSLAYATRRSKSLQEALPILIQASMVFPTEATILFNLACYQAQLGHLEAARGRLKEAIAMDSRFRELAATDPDLAPLHGELGAANP